MFNSGVLVGGLIMVTVVVVAINLADSFIRGKRALMDILKDEDYFE
jgi:hypothetical protein